YRDRLKDPAAGFARTVLRRLEEVLAACVARGIKVVVNAGGLNPAGLAARTEELAGRLGVTARVAYVEGDDLLPRLPTLRASGIDLRHLDKGIPLAALDRPVVTANAYLGAWGIVEALRRGADIVICPRVTDAALALGPAAWKFGWARDDSIRLADDGPDRVRVFGVQGEPPPPTTKVCINYLGGYRNTVTFVLAGLDVEEKARLAEETLWRLVGGRDRFAETSVGLVRSDRPDPRTNDDAFAYLHVTVKDPDAARVGRAFSNKAIEMALASYPGFFVTAPPADASPYGVYWPALVPSDLLEHRVVIGGETIPVPPVAVPPGRHEAR